jgi:hypothetical protein
MKEYMQRKCLLGLSVKRNLPLGGVMKQKTILAEFFGIVCLAVFSLAGCVSYQGQIDRSVPMTEQCTLFVDPDLKNMRFEDETVDMSEWPGSYSVPAGKHTISFDYSSSTYQTQGGYTIKTTSTARGLKVTYDFKPGYKYNVVPFVADRIVAINIEETGKKKSDSFYIGPEARYGMGLGWVPGLFGLFSREDNEDQGYTNMIGWLHNYQLGIIVDNKTLMGFFAEVTAGIGYSPGSLFGLAFHTGGIYELYFGQKETGKLAGFGIGGGTAWHVDDDSNSDDYSFSQTPYIRAAYLSRSTGKFRFFVDYYFNDYDLWKRFGIGFLGMY